MLGVSAARLNDMDKSRLAHNRLDGRHAHPIRRLFQYGGVFTAQPCSGACGGERRAVAAGAGGAGSGKTSVLVARAGWLLTTGEAVADQILLLAFGRKAAQEMDERIRERLHTRDITARTFHALALHIIQQGSKSASHQ